MPGAFGNAYPGEGNRNDKDPAILTYRKGNRNATVSLETHATQQQTKTKSCEILKILEILLMYSLANRENRVNPAPVFSCKSCSSLAKRNHAEKNARANIPSCAVVIPRIAPAKTSVG